MSDSPFVASSLLRGTAAGGELRVVATDATALVREAHERHGLSHTATAALGRSLAAALLLAQVLGKHERSRVALRIEGDGPLGYLVAEASDDGSVRGYVRHPSAELPPRLGDRKLDVGGLIGKGELAVTRLLENGEPYTGSVQLVSGEVAEDVAVYLAKSEQIASAVLLGVYLEGGEVRRAGGVLVQAMPGASEETLSRLETQVGELGTFTDAVEGRELQDLIAELLRGLDPILEAPQPAAFRCRCSEEKALNSLQFFGPEELEDMIQEGGQEVVCHWCNTHYQLTPAQIAELAPAGMRA